MSLIRNWDTSNLVFSINPNALKLGDNPPPFNSGTFPVYQGERAEGKVTATLTNMASGYGYDDGKIKFDGVNGYLLTDMAVNLTNASKHTIEVFLCYNGVASEQVLLANFDDGLNFWGCRITAAGKLRFWSRKTASDYVLSTDTISSGFHVLHFVKDGANLKLYIDGSEVSAYDNQNSYALGDLTLASFIYIGGRSDGVWNSSDIYQVNVYDDAISDTRILANYDAGRWNDGIRGIDNEDDTINLIDPACCVPATQEVLRFGDSVYAKLLNIRKQMVNGDDTFIPLYLNEHHLDDDGGFFANIKYTDGAEIVPTLIDGTELPMELISFDRTGKTISAVIRVPAVLAASDVTIALQYGGNTAVRTIDAVDVWSGCYGGSIDYALAVHGEETFANLVDSSGNYVGALSADQISLHYNNEFTYGVNGLWNISNVIDIEYLSDKYLSSAQDKTCYSCGAPLPEYTAQYCLDTTLEHIAACQLCSKDPPLPANIPICSNCKPRLQEVFVARNQGDI